MSLTSVYERPDRHQLLYDLLKERDETVNVSHRELPAWCDHVRFVESHPYQEWYFIEAGDVVGACYLTIDDEIGVFVFKEYQGHGYGPMAVRRLMDIHGQRRYLANINPRNERSAGIFAKLGFRCVQHTYELA
jgi:RimJ/RimL family protein N-acetyltransferase